MLDPRREVAQDLIEQAYSMQMQGELELAATLYKRSIALCPTAEAHTYLAWTYHFQGRLEAAIAECKKAISVDPTLGNPYNDIGAYLIELNRPDEAIPWLEKAIRSERYEAFHYPWFNLGRAYLAKEMYRRAEECFSQAVTLDPQYAAAVEALSDLRRRVQ